jgi:4-diphosphocytidyl-2-C-methyl-D-erythritol kinase
MPELRVDAYAKVNLTLEVVRRLPNGYHELRTIFQQIELCDELTLAESPDTLLHLTCDHVELEVGPANLVYRAAELMRQRFCPQRGVRIGLCKRIPIGGGLAGGSADAAATLLGLNAMWNIGLSRPDLMALALHLGMDVPFCVLGGTALGKGRGEDLLPLPGLPAVDVVIAHPGVSSSTAEAYAALQPCHMGGGAATEAMVAAIAQRDLPAVAAGLYNVFEESLICRLPAIGRIKSLMIEGGALNAALSGSGACVFALAASPAAAQAVAASVRSEFTEVFVTKTRLYPLEELSL